MKQGFIRWVKKRGGAGLGGAVPVVRGGGVPVLGPAGGGRRFAVCRGDEGPGGLQPRGQPRSHGHPGPGLLFARRRRGLPGGGPRTPGLCHPGPQPPATPGRGGNPAFRRRAGGQFLCEGQHRLRHGFKRRPPGGALGPPETGWQRGNPHLPHPHLRGLLPKLHRLLLHGYGDPHH